MIRNNKKKPPIQSGRGVSEQIQKLLDKASSNLCTEQEKQNSRPMFPGEKHGILPCTKNGKPLRYNYLGPGTNLIKREERADVPINSLDKIARDHDYDYQRAKNDLDSGKIDHDEWLGRVKKADTIFRRKARNDKQRPHIGKLASMAIGAKEVGETSNLISTKLFSGAGSGKLKLKMLKENEEPKPDEKIRKAIMDSIKQNGVGCKFVVESKGDKGEISVTSRKKQSGGFAFLAPLAISLLGGLASKGIDLLIDHFTKKNNKQDGAGMPKLKTKKQKVDFLLENVDHKDLIKRIEMIT